MKNFLYLMIIVLLVGMWFGINIAKDKPLLSNPFEEKDIRDKAKDVALEALQEGKRALKKEVEKER